MSHNSKYYTKTIRPKDSRGLTKITDAFKKQTKSNNREERHGSAESELVRLQEPEAKSTTNNAINNANLSCNDIQFMSFTEFDLY